MTRQQRTARAAIVRAAYYSFVVAVLAVAVIALTGCMVQPVDAVTGEAVGGPVSTLGDVPKTNPKTGNPTVLKKTDEVDQAAAQKGAETAASFLPFPWNVIVGGAAAAGIGAYAGSRRKQQPKP